MHIQVISQLWEPEDGAPQRRWRWLSEALEGASHTVDVICPPPHYPTGRLLSTNPEHQKYSVEQVSDKVTIYRTNFREYTPYLFSRVYDQWIQMISAVRVSLKAARAKRPDLLIATAPPLPALFSQYLLSKCLNVPTIIDLRDAWPDLIDDMLLGEKDVPKDVAMKGGIRTSILKLMAKATRVMMRRCLVDVDGVVTSTQSFSQVLQHRGCKNVITIRNIASIRSIKQRVRDDDKSPLRILYAGTTGRAQGLTPTLRAVHSAIERGAEIEMRIIGGGAHLRTLKRNAAKLDLPVHFYPRMSFSHVQMHYAWTDTELIQLEDWKPLEWTVPSKLYDALASQRHITLVAKGESAEIVESLGAGHVVAPHDEEALTDLLVALYNDRELLKIGSDSDEWLERNCDPSVLSLKFIDFVERIGNLN